MTNETILLVEDNEALREGLKTLLEQEKFTVLAAADGVDGLERMEEVTPDLIVADIVMPRMDGFALCEAVRSRPEWVSVPFIFLTVHREREYLLSGKKLGVEDYLVKPVPPDELLAVIRSRLSRSQQLLFAQLQHSYEASLIMFANAIEVRDAYTRGHVERVVNYTMAIAGQLGWMANSVIPLRYGSILHDIGKIHVRQSILRKNGSLDPAEWVEMKKHPFYGAEIIKGIPFLAPAISIILAHHEYWDGSGYPSGLSGEAIPIAARIVAVADAFDAMTSARPYRAGVSLQEAYDEILAKGGHYYDPEIVRVFQQIWAEGQIHVIHQNN
jgi:putative two-component system response regulator